ncbi:adenosine kinase [Lutimaribacter sp. EGI FJ00015]|uniref:Adenosine kinase n=1 Tax=Lutimaribacter degradans TaxID=2945989 RepID=A0ACC5ZWB2_9RHOB|nr:adenosine kinase [Lutimaribacter sp. EGI FJ00013]MCM2562592.1 adenosine kinase [Lutimaribacter sp. EGI FJ00013]MCO0613749.1 adenosine kinase [Lutimaribacter sp. EGI FJ00015]MCO0636768.1 adenosine kinase [Lutimaribacter sp. EGI FJ00014]
MTKYQLVGIGNAVVDVISQCDDHFLTRMGIDKGVMQLVEQERGEFLYEQMENRVQMAGGSVANSVAGAGALGLSTAFIGRVHDDELGRFYAKGMADDGTDFVNAPVPGGELPTSRSMIFVSPDGERSMNTYLGISSELGPDDVPDDVAGGAQILFLEGYLYDKPKGKEAFERAAELCRKGGGQAGIALSDPFCVDRHRADFRRLVKSLDYVIGNEHEWKSLYETEDLGHALEQAASDSGLIVCTRSGHDVVLVRGDEMVNVPVNPVTPVDATGAGDQFAAGFLYGLSTGATLTAAGRMGCIAAAEVIGHYGARPETDVKALFKAEGLI